MFDYIFGPVNSRRLGASLGIDLLGDKICSFNCVYCEVRKTETLTTERKAYVLAEEIIRELELFFRVHPDEDLNYITFSGQGEPTLSSELGLVIDYIKDRTEYKVCVLTNASLLEREDVIHDLKRADLVIPSLDAVSEKAYKKINLPEKSISVDNLINGILKLKQEFSGEIWLEILFVEGINDNDEEIALLKEKVKLIQPDRVYLNTIYRPPAFSKFYPISKTKLKTLENDFNSLLTHKKEEIKVEEDKKHHQWTELEIQEQIQPMLNIRPCSYEDLFEVFCKDKTIDEVKLKSILQGLLEKQVIDIEKYQDTDFYVLKK